MSTKTEDRTLLAVDVGAGAIKVWGAGGGVELLAQVAHGHLTEHAKAAGFTAARRPMCVSFDGLGGSFWVGPRAHGWGRSVENLTDDRFAGSPEVRALLYGALSLYDGIGGLPSAADLILGLPQSAFDGAEAERRIGRIKRWVRGRHAWTVDGAQRGIEVRSVKVTTQTAGALFDYLLTDDGRFLPARRDHYRGEIGIVSVGMNTLELLAVRNGAPVPRFQASVTAGVRRLFEIVDPGGLYSRGYLDESLRAGSLDIRGARAAWAAEVAGHIERAWGRAFRRFAAIVIVGGGAVLLKADLLAQLNGRGFMPPLPVLAVARGLYKLGNKGR